MLHTFFKHIKEINNKHQSLHTGKAMQCLMPSVSFAIHYGTLSHAIWMDGCSKANWRVRKVSIKHSLHSPTHSNHPKQVKSPVWVDSVQGL